MIIMNTEKLIGLLDSHDRQTRLSAVQSLADKIKSGEIPAILPGDDVNSHIHTTYSFSPYTPAAAVWHSCRAGLKTTGIMDHDSVGGAEEFIEAGRLLGILTTVGVECRVKMTDTAIEHRRINNPDQDGVAYMALHGIPHTQIPRIREFFAPYTARRIERGRKMTENINALFAPHCISLDFDRDILSLSMAHDSGSVTERHILYALAAAVSEKYPVRTELVEFLETRLSLNINDKIRGFLLDTENKIYLFDLLGILKSSLIAEIYIPAGAECPDVREVLSLAEETGAIPAYAYLGDVGDSVTGDKKSQSFEDSYIEILFEALRELGFRAVTYMPSRNTPAQLRRVRELCEEYGFFQISGEDINSPRQEFICLAQRADEFAPLRKAALALIGHEQAATRDLRCALFSAETVRKYPDLSRRIEHYISIVE